MTTTTDNPTTSLTPTLDSRPLAEIDPQIHQAIEQEKQRQQTHIELIASENFTLPAIIESTGSVLTNKYAEGYPAKRYYGGCEHVDVAESLAIERAKRLFGAEHANVQPHSGSQQTLQFILRCCNLGQNSYHEPAGWWTFNSWSPKNCSGMLYNVINYGVDPESGGLIMILSKLWLLKKSPSLSPLVHQPILAPSILKEWEKLPKKITLCSWLILLT